MAQEFHFKDEQDWLDKRAQYVTSSEICLLFDINKYGKTKFSLWHEKSSGEVPDDFDKKRMMYGRETEVLIGRLFEIEQNLQLKPMKFFSYDDETRLGSSFDFEVESKGFYKGWIVECKNVDGYIYKSDWTETEAPLHIEYQVQLQLLLSGRPGAFIVAFVGGNELKFIRREPNALIQRAILKKAAEFWKDVDHGIEPSPDLEGGADIDNVLRLYRDADTGVPAVLTDELQKKLEQYELVKELQAGAEKTAKALKAQIFYMVKDADHVDIGNGEFYNMTKTKDSKGTLITKEMIGTVIGDRSGYRQLRLQKIKKGRS